jgi:hypothetical protein
MRDVKTGKNFVELIQDLYRRSKYKDVKEAYNDIMKTIPEDRRPFSKATLTNTIHQGQKTTPSKGIEMAFMLGAAPEQIVTALKIEGDFIYRKLIIQEGLPLDAQGIAEKYIALPDEKKKLVQDLLNTIGG